MLEVGKFGSRKGVTSQSVKDVVQTLVDDGFVSKDKIGTSVRNVSTWIISKILMFQLSVIQMEFKIKTDNRFLVFSIQVGLEKS